MLGVSSGYRFNLVHHNILLYNETKIIQNATVVFLGKSFLQNVLGFLLQKTNFIATYGSYY